MKKKFLVLGVSVLVLGMLLVSAIPSNPGGNGKGLDRKKVIVTFEEDADRDVIKKYGKIKKEFNLIRGLSADMTDEEISVLEGIIGVRVFEDRIVHAVLDDSVPMISANLVHSAGVTGSSVVVCVVDTGVDDSHPALPSLIVEIDYVNNDLDATDDNGHGTHVAGIVASQDAMYRGVAPGASLMAAKVLDSTGSGTESWVIAGIDWCVTNNADVITLSLGADYSGDCDTEAMGMAVNNAVAQGVVVTAAAGNGGRDVILPACASGPIAVAVVDKSNVLPWWSSRGLEVDITAPGVSIYSTYLNNGWASMSGTSMATPHVAGTAALLLQTKPTATVDEIKNAIYNTADPVSRCYKCTRFWWWGDCRTQAEVACTPELVGHGLVNAYNAYLAIKPTEPACTVDADCDDNLSCNGAETCVTGVCQAGTPIDCSASGDQCNVGVCDETIGCIVQPKSDGISCDDGLFCTVGETCQSGVCTGGSVLDCSNLTGQCSVGGCDENIDSCVRNPINEGGLCDDGLFCTVSDTCTSGVCDGVDRVCLDGVACTIDTCDDVSDSCVYTPDDTLCGDGLFCTGVEYCDPSLGCQAGTPVVCDDGSACTTDTCSDDIGACLYEPKTACVSDDGCCPAGCDYTNDNDCPASVLCWSSSYNYLKNGGDSNQLKKFCKCAQGAYSYKGYRTLRGTKTAYWYIDSRDNLEWATTPGPVFRPVYNVRCSDGVYYPTNVDYYYG